MTDSFNCRVAGISFNQGAVKMLEPNEPMELVREPDNSHDGNAIRVMVKRLGCTLGHIPKSVAALLAPFMDDGGSATAILDGLMPGGTDEWGDKIPDGVMIRVHLGANLNGGGTTMSKHVNWGSEKVTRLLKYVVDGKVTAERAAAALGTTPGKVDFYVKQRKRRIFANLPNG